MAFWTPNLGPQAEAAICPAKFPLFGGSRGGGKTDCLWGRHLRGVERYGKHWNGLILRHQYEDFGELRHRIDQMITGGLAAVRVGGDMQPNIVRFDVGARVRLRAVARLEKIDAFVGQQYTEISIDEATTFPFFYKMVDKLKGSNRSPYGVPCSMFATGNPGGPGHSSVKEYFQLGSQFNRKPKTVFYVDGESRVFIPSFLTDNPYLCRDDEYKRTLEAIRDPMLRRAWIEGDWDVYMGQAFLLSERHILKKPVSIPDWAEIYMTYDWGYGSPFSIGWWWADNDGRVFRFAEWYGWNGVPNEGLRLADSEVVQGILDREQELGISNRQIIRITGPDCFSKRPTPLQGGQGPPTAEVFASRGVFLTPGDPTRHVKIRQFRERLLLPEDKNEMPMLMVYPNCTQFLRTIPDLTYDDLNPEDVDRKQETHCYDEACHIAMARPMSTIPRKRVSLTDRRIDLLLSEKATYDVREEGALITEKRLISDMDEDEGLFEPEFESGIEPGDELKYDVG